MKLEIYKVKTGKGTEERVKLTKFTYSELIAICKLNASVMIRVSKSGFVFGQLMLGAYDSEGKKGIREYKFIYIENPTRYIKTKKYDISQEGQISNDEVMKIVAKLYNNDNDALTEIIMGKKTYDRHAELISCFRNINNDVLQKSVYFGYSKTKENMNIGIFEVRYPWVSGRPQVVYFFRENASVLTFNKKGFDIQYSPDIKNISDVICG